MNPTAGTLARCFLLGAATGGRSTSGIAALAWTAGRQDPAWLRSPVTRVVSALAASGELVGDKLPQAPSRLQPAALGGRLVSGGASGWLLSGRRGANPLVGAAAGVAGAVAGSFAGARWRGVAAERFGRDLPGALLEDAKVVAVALAATR